jgi:hypothetical protein
MEKNFRNNNSDRLSMLTIFFKPGDRLISNKRSYLGLLHHSASVVSFVSDNPGLTSNPFLLVDASKTRITN